MEDRQIRCGVGDPVVQLAVNCLALFDVGRGDALVPQLVHVLPVVGRVLELDVERADHVGLRELAVEVEVAGGGEPGGGDAERLLAHVVHVRGRVEAVDLGNDADVGHVLLEHLGHLLEVAAGRAVDHADVDAVGICRLGQVFLCLVGVVVVDDAFSRGAHVLLLDHKVGVDGQTVVAGHVHRVLVDAVSDRLAQVFIVERLGGGVDDQERDMVGGDQFGVVLVVVLQIVPVGDRGDVPVELAGFKRDQTGRSLRDRLVVQLFDRGFAAVILRERAARPLDVMLERRQIVRARAGKSDLRAEFFALFGHFAFTDNENIAEAVKECGVRL